MIPVWLTYAWNDNSDGDVDFVAQQLNGAGLETRIDRWTVTAGQRLWDQIGAELSKDDLAAWIILATQHSCGSEACKEELAYALDRALGKRGQGFPVIALFQGRVETDLLPPSLKVRLCVTTTDQHWIERIKAAAARRPPAIPREELNPYFLKVHQPLTESSFGKYAIEVRPRAGSWAPFFAAIAESEKENVKMLIGYGARNHVPNVIALRQSGEFEAPGLWGLFAGDEASPTMSYYIFCSILPSALVFGVLNSQPQFKVLIQQQ